VAEELHGTARAQLWPMLVAQYPSLGEAQAKTTRQFPVFLRTANAAAWSATSTTARSNISWR
jgi:hypothetical protein